MLRIGTKGKTPLPPTKEELPTEPGAEPGVEPGAEPTPESTSEQMPEPLPTEDPANSEAAPDGKDEKGGGLDPIVAGYKGPEQGPFMCGNCKYFLAPSSCEFVSGEIDEMGVCNIFSASPGHDGQDAAEGEPPAEPDAPLTEAPLPPEEPSA